MYVALAYIRYYKKRKGHVEQLLILSYLVNYTGQCMQ